MKGNGPFSKQRDAPSRGGARWDIGQLRPGELLGRRRAQVRARRRRRLAGRLLITFLILACLPAIPLLFLRWFDPPVTSYIMQADAPVAARRWLSLQEMGAFLPLAVVASEDQHFPSHFGFDIAAIRQVLEQPGAPRRGASTISQQTAKNLFLWPGGYIRKGLEAWITLWMEGLWPKARILEVYLNVAEFGTGRYGAWAGARQHFDRAPAQLTRQQAATLVALLPSPRRLTPQSPSVGERAVWIEQQMGQLGSDYLASLDR